jgi:predicted nucleic acid-binding protein
MARDLVYWDANAFLGLLNEEPDKRQACEDVWVAAQKGQIAIVTSTLTVAEVIYVKGLPKLDPNKRPLVNNFFRQPHIVQRPVTRTIAELARDVVWDCAIRPKDAIHIATAAYHKIAPFHTFDGALVDSKVVAAGGFSVLPQFPRATRQYELPIAEDNADT